MKNVTKLTLLIFVLAITLISCTGKKKPESTIGGKTKEKEVLVMVQEMQLQNGVVGTNLENSAMEIYEVAGRIDVDTGILPVYTYAQYAVNEAAIDSDQNTAWLAGFGAKYGSFKLNYNYRDTQRFAVADTFNDSDFAIGNVAARGHKVKASYKISKNFSLGSAYLAAREYSGRNTDIFQLDLKAKF